MVLAHAPRVGMETIAISHALRDIMDKVAFTSAVSNRRKSVKSVTRWTGIWSAWLVTVVITVNTLVIHFGTAKIVRQSVRVSRRTRICVIRRKDNVFVNLDSEEKSKLLWAWTIHVKKVPKTLKILPQNTFPGLFMVLWQKYFTGNPLLWGSTFSVFPVSLKFPQINSHFSPQSPSQNAFPKTPTSFWTI